MQLWKDEHGGAEVWMCRQHGACVSSPAEGTRATAALTGPASLLRAPLQSGCSSCRAGVHSSAAERRKMKGGQAKPQAG